MSSDFPPNPFSQPPGSQLNPYNSPQIPGGRIYQGKELVQAIKRKLLPPAIFLCVVGVLGLGIAFLNVVLALIMTPPPLPPDAPEFVKGMQKGQFGPVAAVIQSIFMFVNITIIVSAIQMMRVKIRPMGFVGAILAMINFGAFCCILGLPAGIWSFIILCQPDVAKAYEANQ